MVCVKGEAKELERSFLAEKPHDERAIIRSK